MTAPDVAYDVPIVTHPYEARLRPPINFHKTKTENIMRIDTAFEIKTGIGY